MLTGRGELRPHSAHALAGGTLALGGFALEHQNVFASGGGQVIGNARADDPSADDDDFRGLHEICIVVHGR